MQQLSSGQTIATYYHNILQHRWPSICKLRPNDRNISAKHIATLLGVTCWARLATLLRRVATCRKLKIELVRMPRCSIVVRVWPNDYNIMQHRQMLQEKFDQFQIWANNTQHVATLRNTSQLSGQTHETCYAQHCCDVLRWNVAIVWPGLKGFGKWAAHRHLIFLGVPPSYAADGFVAAMAKQGTD